MKYILIPTPTKDDVEKIKETIEIKNMYFCYAGSEIDKEDKDTIIIKLIYAAHLMNNETIVFIQYLKEKVDKITEGTMLEGGFFEAEGFINEHLVYQTYFFIGESDGIITDFNCTFNFDGRRYEFYGYNANGYKKYSINNTTMTGLNIMNRCILNKILNSDSVREINLWLNNSSEGRNNAEMYAVTDFSVLDISKSIKVEKGLYTGVLAINFTINDSIPLIKNPNSTRVYTALMSYYRDKPLSKKKYTIDISNMEEKYSDALTIGTFTGRPINSLLRTDGIDLQLIAAKPSDNEFIILNVPNGIYNELNKFLSTSVRS